MKRAMIISLIVILGLGSSAALAQNPYQGQHGSSAVPGLSKELEYNAIKMMVEMTLLYKMLGQPSIIASNDGFVVLFGSKISKYDKELNLVKEINLKLDVSSMQELVSKVAGSYSEEVMKAMGGSTEIINAGMNDNDALAKATLRAISTAAESYAAANSGKYPSSIFDLTHAIPAYLNTDYCNQEIAGYIYSCDFKTTGYKITATPSKSGKQVHRFFSITTGGVLKP
jgi:hypothetical protein